MENVKNVEVSKVVRNAFLFLNKATKTEKINKAGNKLPHPEYRACILARFVDNENVIAAAILQDILVYDSTSMSGIYEKFGMEIGDLVYELTDIPTNTDTDNMELQLVKYFNNLSSDAFTIQLVNKLHETLSLIDTNVPYGFVKLQVEDTTFIINSITRNINKTQKRLLLMLKLIMFYVELTRNV